MAGWSARVSRTAPVARERVWETLLDGRRWSRWNGGFAWMAVDDALRAGEYITVAPKRGRQTALRILDVRPSECLALLLRFGPLAPMLVDITLSGGSDETTVDVTFSVNGIGTPLVLKYLAVPLAERSGDDLERLLELAASSPEAPAERVTE